HRACRGAGREHPVSGTGSTVRQDGIESEIRRIGGDLAEALPGRSRNPLRAIDERAIDLAASDRELRAALFRFVDVVPACRSADELAIHLRAYLAEVPDSPPAVAVAMRVSGSRPGRAALGRAAAAGVRHMAHRFIIGE